MKCGLIIMVDLPKKKERVVSFLWVTYPGGRMASLLWVTCPGKKKKMENGLILMGDLPRKKNGGLIVMGDLPKWKGGRVVSFLWVTYLVGRMVSYYG